MIKYGDIVFVITSGLVGKFVFERPDSDTSIIDVFNERSGYYNRNIQEVKSCTLVKADRGDIEYYYNCRVKERIKEKEKLIDRHKGIDYARLIERVGRLKEEIENTQENIFLARKVMDFGGMKDVVKNKKKAIVEKKKAIRRLIRRIDSSSEKRHLEDEMDILDRKINEINKKKLDILNSYNYMVKEIKDNGEEMVNDELCKCSRNMSELERYMEWLEKSESQECIFEGK